MDDMWVQQARTYASRFQLQLAERLGFGIHGIIFAARGNLESGATAIKVHRAAGPYFRELAVYQRLQAAGIRRLLGFHVPRLLRQDDELRVIEMDIVTRPFVLDFAGAYLDTAPEFSEETWVQWEAEKQEQFEARWPRVRRLLAALEDLGIHMIDVSPGNVAFPEE